MDECMVRWLLSHKARVKWLMLRNGEKRFYNPDLLLPTSHPRGYCKDEALRDALAIYEIMLVEKSSALSKLLTYYVNAIYDPITSSRNRREFKENYAFLKRLLREYEKEYQDRMQEESSSPLLSRFLTTT
jgi:hypothetical protein